MISAPRPRCSTPARSNRAISREAASRRAPIWLAMICCTGGGEMVRAPFAMGGRCAADQDKAGGEYLGWRTPLPAAARLPGCGGVSRTRPARRPQTSINRRPPERSMRVTRARSTISTVAPSATSAPACCSTRSALPKKIAPSQAPAGRSPHPDHTDAFWNEVDKVMPNYAERKEWLRVNGAGLDV